MHKIFFVLQTNINMKKLLLITLSVIIASVGLMSQSIEILDVDENVINNQTITVSGDPSQSQVTYPFKLKNVTSGQISAIIMKEYVDVVEGSESMFCTPSGTCYLPFHFESNAFALDAGEISATCEVYFLPEGLEGVSTLKHRVFLENDPSDYAEFYITFDISAGTDIAVKPQNREFSVFPNPASSQFYFANNYNNTHVEVYDVIGKIIKKENIKSDVGTFMFDCSGWERGVYFLRASSDNQSKTFRLVIR